MNSDLSTYSDATMTVPALRKVWREERKRLRRRARRQVRAAKTAFLDSL